MNVHLGGFNVFVNLLIFIIIAFLIFLPCFKNYFNCLICFYNFNIFVGYSIK